MLAYHVTTAGGIACPHSTTADDLPNPTSFSYMAIGCYRTHRADMGNHRNSVALPTWTGSGLLLCAGIRKGFLFSGKVMEGN